MWLSAPSDFVSFESTLTEDYHTLTARAASDAMLITENEAEIAQDEAQLAALQPRLKAKQKTLAEA